ncbi:MAG: hypothetical protein WB565_10100 [Acidimicrobiales bacterium]
MSTVSRVPKLAWFVIGVVVTALVIPTAAGAKGLLKLVGIEGSNGNQVSVTAAGQLKTAAASPSSFYQDTSVPIFGAECTTAPCTSPWYPIAAASSTSALVVTVVHVEQRDVYATQLNLVVYNTSNCGGGGGSATVGTYGQTIGFSGGALFPGRDDPLDPGLVIPVGDALCAQASFGQNVPSAVIADASASGYSIPAAAALAP